MSALTVSYRLTWTTYHVAVQLEVCCSMLMRALLENSPDRTYMYGAPSAIMAYSTMPFFAIAVCSPIMPVMNTEEVCIIRPYLMKFIQFAE